MVLTGSLDLFELMVNNVAGNILLSLIIWAMILLITGIMGRLSMQSILVILGTFAAASLIGYLGSFAFLPMFIVSLIYMYKGVMNWINEIR